MKKILCTILVFAISLAMLAACTTPSAVQSQAPASSPIAVPVVPEATGLAHVGIFVSDVERSKKFYKDTLGLELIEQCSFDDSGNNFTCAFMKKGSVCLELVQKKPAWGELKDGVTDHVAFAVNDVDAFRKVLEGKGIKFESEQQAFCKDMFPHGTKWVFIRGPDNEHIELNQMLSSSTTVPDVPQVTGLAHIGVFVADVERSEKYYKDILGFNCVEECSFDDSGNTYTCYFVEKGNVSVELVQKKPAWGELKDGVTDHIAYAVDDIEALRKVLEAKGIKFESDKQSFCADMFPNGTKWVFFRGPDNEHIEISQIL
jgi:lactoylglutathione lyase